MTLEECYRALGGSYSEVLARLIDDKMITKYLNKFTEDTSYRDIFTALENNDYETAFRAAHTLKGICLNLGLENLYKAHIRSPRLCVRKRTKPLRKCWTS